MASPALPPLPTDSNATGPNPSTPAQDAPPPQSAFAGGLPGIVQSITQIERGYKMLAGMLPSLAPLAADAISKLRTAIPNAVGAGAGQPPPQGQPQGQGPSGSQGQLPPPPPQGAQ